MTLVLDKVVKRFGDFTAVNDLSIEIPGSQIFGLLGANGAGKTTTFRMILDLLKPTTGTISWNGHPITYNTTHLIGYLPEERGLYPKLKIYDQMLYLGKLKGMKKADIIKELKAWLERFGVPEYYDKKVEDLSKGNQQKIQFIAAVIHKPKLIILDEPFTGLDPVNVELMKQAVKELQSSGVSIIFSSHRMDHVEELCENLCIMHKGRPVVSGSLKQVKADYGKKNVVIRGDFDTDDLKSKPGVLKYDRDHRRTQLQVEKEDVAMTLFEEIKNRGFVREFQIVEPTLQEIFIEKVGDHHE